MRVTYWSSSKLADAIRGTPKPEATSIQGWADWKYAAKQAHPVRYWIAETFLDWCQDVVNFPSDCLFKIRYYVLNRWVTKTHALTSRSLEKGEWWDMDSRILHCMFDSLVDFVEIELAMDMCRWSEERYEQYKIGPWRIRSDRSVQAGVDNLFWQITSDEVPDQQRQNAQEILDLYTWWKDIRPSRRDAHDVSGWTEYCNRTPFTYKSEEEKSPEERKQIKQMLDRIYEIEEQYKKEDTDMLVRLIMIRSALWT